MVVISTEPLVSIVIPHLNEPEDLRRCLAALATQADSGIPVEIIVVDNGSRQLPRDLCAAFGARLEVELTPGPGPARSRGADLARGDIVAFIDADCLVQPGWLRSIAEFFDAHPEIDFTAGAIGIARLDPNRPTMFEAYEEQCAYRVKLYVERDRYAATGNMAVRRAVWQAVGPFGGIATMEDREWGQRASALGYRLAYLPAARVLTPACKSFLEITRRWDRHIAHEFRQRGERRYATARWLLFGLAVAVSPAVEALRLPWRGPDLTLRERLLALRCLARVRLYRARKMVSLLRDDRALQIIGSWNRD
jgi:glycosyltransferase involved in cell wall biosynthesis